MRNPISTHNLRHSSHSGRPRNINLVPIDYAFRPRLRGRLTLRGLALRRNPWTFGESVSHTLYRYSCQHSHFRYLQSTSRILLHRLTERSATTQMPDDRGQMTEGSNPGLAVQSVEHPGDLLIGISPGLPCVFVDITQIQAVSRPDPHLLGTAQRH